jgi:uncharacterized repeat protein (TIGR03806 family)
MLRVALRKLGSPAMLCLAGNLLLACSADEPAVTPKPVVEESYCDQPGSGVNIDVTLPPCEKLSSYRLFKGTGYSQEPNEGVIPYALNTPLFSDYALKSRFIWLPQGKSAPYNATGVLKFPVGTVLVKTFAFPKDMRSPGKDVHVVETRLLVHRPEGWVGLPYVWNDDRTDAVLQVEGKTVPLEFTTVDGAGQKVGYVVPNANQCKGCHKGLDGMNPIGPKARNLNRLNTYGGAETNQLTALASADYLTGLPALAEVPKVAVWNDPATTVTLEERARAYLDNNCAHCHNPRGPARTSGLDLSLGQTDPAKYGICKPPVAAGKGAGNLAYDIVPTKPESSILVFRMNSVDPGIMMPEVGRTLIHTEGVALLKEWIAAMPAASCTSL